MVKAEEYTATPGVEMLDIVSRYLHREISLRDLHEWLGCHTTWVMTAPRDNTTELADLIQLNIAEIGLGHSTESDLHKELSEFLDLHPMTTIHLT